MSLRNIFLVSICLYSLYVIGWSIFYLFLKTEQVNEFNALNSLSRSIMGFLLLSMYCILIFIQWKIKSNKTWAYIVSMIILAMSIPVFNVQGGFNHLTFEIASGAPISVESEILPSIFIFFVSLGLVQKLKENRA